MKVSIALSIVLVGSAFLVGCQKDGVESDLDSYPPPTNVAEEEEGFQLVEGLTCKSSDSVATELSITVKKHKNYLESSKVSLQMMAKSASGIEFKKESEATASEFSLTTFLIKDEHGNVLASNEGASYLVPIAGLEEDDSFDMTASVFLKSTELKVAAGGSQRELRCKMDKKSFGDVSRSAQIALMDAVFKDNHLFSGSLQSAEKEMATRGFTRAVDKVKVANSHNGRPTGMTELKIPYEYKGGTLGYHYEATVSVETRFVDGKFTVLDLQGLAVKKVQGN